MSGSVQDDDRIEELGPEIVHDDDQIEEIGSESEQDDNRVEEPKLESVHESSASSSTGIATPASSIM